MKRWAIAWRLAAGDPVPPAAGAEELHARARLSVKLLLGRQALIQALTFGAGIVLARTLAPADFGLFVPYRRSQRPPPTRGSRTGLVKVPQVIDVLAPCGDVQVYLRNGQVCPLTRAPDCLGGRSAAS